MLTGDSLHTEFERRVIALEEAKRRLRRKIRAAAKAYAWTGSFEAGRWEATTYEWLNRPRPRAGLDLHPIPGDEE